MKSLNLSVQLSIYCTILQYTLASSITMKIRCILALDCIHRITYTVVGTPFTKEYLNWTKYKDFQTSSTFPFIFHRKYILTEQDIDSLPQ